MIPLQFHFIFGLQPDFGGKPFSFFHYMAVKSALSVHPGAKAFFYYEHEPRGIYWEVARRYVETVPIKAPTEFIKRTRNVSAPSASASVVNGTSGQFLLAESPSAQETCP